MLFNSLDFAIFFVVFFIIYWLILKNSKKNQNLFILFSSYIFYGWWDWRFLSLIALSTIIDFTLGQLLSVSRSHKKFILSLSIVSNLGILVLFKYFNFFIDSLKALNPTMFDEGFSTLNVILPVGISFYTFQTLSYSIDIYNKKIDPEQNFIAFAAFVSFFPQLVAGPIERASHLLPQFMVKRVFSYSKSVEGIRQMLWGFFKKVVIADNCAHFVNIIFENYNDYSGAVLITGAILFAFQIYGDFSGYSDIAIGLSKILGFDLMKNFAFPYFSRDIAEFWRRWHISLSTWFRDYLYIPLGGSRVSILLQIRNTFIIFIVSGFWHGANWTFIVWGLIHACMYLPLLLFKSNRKNVEFDKSLNLFSTLINSVKMLSTFCLVTIAWIFFRSANIAEAWSYLDRVSTFNENYFVFDPDLITLRFVFTISFIFLGIYSEWLSRELNYGLEWVKAKSNYSQYVIYTFLAILIFVYSSSESEFIYFQF